MNACPHHPPIRLPKQPQLAVKSSRNPRGLVQPTTYQGPTQVSGHSDGRCGMERMHVHIQNKASYYNCEYDA